MSLSKNFKPEKYMAPFLQIDDLVNEISQVWERLDRLNPERSKDCMDVLFNHFKVHTIDHINTLDFDHAIELINEFIYKD